MQDDISNREPDLIPFGDFEVSETGTHKKLSSQAVRIIELEQENAKLRLAIDNLRQRINGIVDLYSPK